jgi:hypothetical protein
MLNIHQNNNTSLREFGRDISNKNINYNSELSSLGFYKVYFFFIRII